MKRKTVLRGIKVILFIVVFLILYQNVSSALTSSDDRNYQWVTVFFEEEKNHLDAVYLGSSCTYAFFQAPIAFARYGITVRPLCSKAQPLAAAKYLIEDARKFQPNALYIIPINTLREIKGASIHYLTDYYPMSVNKIKMIWSLSDIREESISDRLEYYFPVIRYHSRWNSLGYSDFHYTYNGLKGGSDHSEFLAETMDISEAYTITDKRVALDPSDYDVLIDLLEYCKNEQLNVLFVTVPQSKDEETIGKYNTLNDLIKNEYGFPVLDMIDKVEEIGLNLKTDYYNEPHTNIHGSIKITNYISEYLIEHYNFTDKRNLTEYQDWSDAARLYQEVIADYVQEEELTTEKAYR